MSKAAQRTNDDRVLEAVLHRSEMAAERDASLFSGHEGLRSVDEVVALVDSRVVDRFARAVASQRSRKEQTKAHNQTHVQTNEGLPRLISGTALGNRPRAASLMNDFSNL